VTLRAEDEGPRPATGPGFADALTFAFGDPREGLFGLARLELAAQGATGAAALFAGGELVVARAEAAEPVEDFGQVRAAGLRAAVDEPLRAWSLAFDAGDDGGFALELRALSLGAELAARARGAGEVAGYVHLCAVDGTVRAGAGHHRVRCLGQRARRWLAPDGEPLAQVRSVGAWLGDDLALAVVGLRPAAARGHDEEVLSACVLEGERPAVPVQAEEVRLSTTTGGDGQPRVAGLELWAGDDDRPPRHAAGELRCATTLDLGRRRLECAFLGWRMEGREGIGCIEAVRPAR
jgi:hypothetical protein